MKLALTSAILQHMNLAQVSQFLNAQKVTGLEAMCWPPKSGDTRKFAGVTHVDVTDLNVEGVLEMVSVHNVSLTSLGYYPNVLSPKPSEREAAQTHVQKVIFACQKLGLNVFNTFPGRNPRKSVEDNLKEFAKFWEPTVSFAEAHGVRVAFEGCPMHFSTDEFPKGKNLAFTPATWRKMRELVPNIWMNLDPSHLVLLGIDPVRVVKEFGDQIIHVHAKDLAMNPEGLYQHGYFTDEPKLIHTPKIPGRGDVPWEKFFAALKQVGYDGWVSIEVEDSEFKTDEERERAVVLSVGYLEQFVN